MIDFVIRTEPNYNGDSILAYADDILLISQEVTDLQTNLNILDQAIQAIRLKMNPNKCFTLHLDPSPMEAKDTTLTIGNVPVPHLLDGDCLKFLGKPLGFNICKDDFTLQYNIDIGQKILSSALAPWQRIDALKSFFFPSLQFDLRTVKGRKPHGRRLTEHSPGH